MEMQRVVPQDDKLLGKAAASEEKPDSSDWWFADLAIPFEAAAVNFVINYQNHYDNNGSQDHKLNVSRPPLHKGPLRLNPEETYLHDFHFPANVFIICDLPITGMTADLS